MLAKNNQKLLCQVCLFLFCLFSSCEEPAFTDTVVLTEDILYVSGERAVLSGRFISPGGITVEDHGFVIDTDESFISPLTIALGPKTKPGPFFGETNELTNESQYWFRSYIQQSGTTIYGETLPLSTLAPVLDTYGPTIGAVGTSLEIKGGNFTQDTEVYFGDQKATITAFTLESNLRVTIPSVGDEFIVPIKVIVQDDTLVFDQPFEYVTGVWTQESQFINQNAYFGSVYFTEGNNLIFGLGRENRTYNSKLWIMDLAALSWSELAYDGLPVHEGFSTSSYFGAGISRNPNFPGDITNHNNQFWKHQGGVISLEGSIPFLLVQSIAFSFGQDLYVTGGVDEIDVPNRNLYHYDASLENWQVLGQNQFDISVDYPHFQYEDDFYVIDADNLVRKYSIAQNSWSVVSTFPGEVKLDALASVVNGKAYIGLFEFTRALWEFDLTTGAWKSKNSFPGDSFERNVAYWSYNDQIFVMKNANGSSSMQIWSFSPDEF